MRFGRPMPPTVSRARAVLARTLSSAMSLERQEIESDDEQSIPEHIIGSDEVAKALGVTPRTVQRNAEALGGRRISGAWVFDRDEIGA